MGKFLSDDENRVDWNAAILYYRTALLHCIYYCCTGFLTPKMKLMNLRTLGYGSILGLLLFGVFAFLVPGMKYTTASNAGFLVGIVSVFVPVVHSFLKHKLPSKRTTLGVLLALLGICLLTFLSTFTINLGDILCILSAFSYTIQIILMDYFTKETDSFLLGIWQLGFTGLYGVIFTFLFETPLTSRQWRAVGCNSWSGDTLQCFWIYRSASCSRIHISGTYQHAFRTGTSIFYDFCLYFSP